MQYNFLSSPTRLHRATGYLPMDLQRSCGVYRLAFSSRAGRVMAGGGGQDSKVAPWCCFVIASSSKTTGELIKFMIHSLLFWDFLAAGTSHQWSRFGGIGGRSTNGRGGPRAWLSNSNTGVVARSAGGWTVNGRDRRERRIWRKRQAEHQLQGWRARLR